MYCIYMLTIACSKMFLRSKQAVFFSLFTPLMILVIFGFINFDGPLKLSVGLVTHNPTPQTAFFVDHIRKFKSFAVSEGPLQKEMDALNDGDLMVVLDIPDHLLPAGAGDAQQVTAYINQGRPSEAQAAMTILSRFFDQANLAIANVPQVLTLQTKSVDSKNLRYIEFLLPGIIAMSIMQMSVFSVALVFARFKEKGVLKRLLATPMRPYQFVSANVITRLVMACAQAAIFLTTGIWIFHAHVLGSYWLVAACVILGSLMFLGLGFTISGLSKTVESVPVMANLVVFPMFFLGNVFFSVNNLSPWLRAIAKWLPLTFLATSMRQVMTEGAGIRDIQKDLIGMAVWGVILITMATFTFRFQDPDGG
jgi:ABC-2 type transport system permease protein